MLEFGHRLKELRHKFNIKTQDDLGNILGLSRHTIAKYESGQRFPEPDILIKIADNFNISLDFLLGRTDDDVNKERESAEYLQNLLKEKSLTRKELARRLNISIEELEVLTEGKLPNLKVLKLVTEYLNVPYKELAKNHKEYNEDIEFLEFLTSGNYIDYLRLAKWIYDNGIKPSTVKNLLEINLKAFLKEPK